MISFIHTADIHFGVENYGKIDPTTGIHSRLLDFKKCLEFCVDTAIERDVDFFLFSGDAYKTAHPTPTQQKLFLQQFLRLYQANIPVMIVVGNHDQPMSYGKAHALDIFSDLPVDGFHIFGKPAARKITTKNGPVQIVGIPWPTRHILMAKHQHQFANAQEIALHLSERVASIIQAFATKLDPQTPSILAGHLTVSEGIFSGSEKTAILGTDPILTPSQLAIEPFNYVGLGHLHRFQDLNPHGSCPIVYSGSPERIDFGERKEDKGFCYVTISDDKTTRYEFIKTPARPMIQYDINLTTSSPQTTQILTAIEQRSLADAIVKIVYHLPAEAHDQVDLSVIQQACNNAWHIAGIIPVHQVKTRERRSLMTIEMNEQEMIRHYFQNKQLEPAVIEKLLQKADLLLNPPSES